MSPHHECLPQPSCSPLGWIHLMRPELSPTRHTFSWAARAAAAAGLRTARGLPSVTLLRLMKASISPTLAWVDRPEDTVLRLLWVRLQAGPGSLRALGWQAMLEIL